MKRKTTRKERKTPPAEYEKVCIRSGGAWVNGECVGGHCEDCGATEFLQFSHTKHRKIGGTTSKKVHNHRNIKRRCRTCHDKLDDRKMGKPQPIDRPMALSGTHGTGMVYNFSREQQASGKR